MGTYFIDFEASSLSFRSFPIEVAWGSTINNIEEYLISPFNIPYWKDWSFESERLHGLSKSFIIANGFEPEFVCERILANLNGKKVLSDNPDWDSMWLARLFDACGLKYPEIDMRHLDSDLIELVCPRLKNRISGLNQILKFKVSARHQIGLQHRAGYDVQYLINLWELATKSA